MGWRVSFRIMAALVAILLIWTLLAVLDLPGQPATQWLSVWNDLAIASGGVIGGLLLDNAGAASFPWEILAVTAVAFLCAYFGKKHAFRPGGAKALRESTG